MSEPVKPVVLETPAAPKSGLLLSYLPIQLHFRRTVSLPERQLHTPRPLHRRLAKKQMSCPEFGTPENLPLPTIKAPVEPVLEPVIGHLLEPIITLPLPHSLFSLKRSSSLDNLSSLKRSPSMKFNQ